MFDFELQLFAEEETETTEQKQEEMTDVTDLPADVLAELDGYDKPQEEPEQEEQVEIGEPEQKEEPQAEENTATAEADSDNKQYDGIEKPKGKVPYGRFKEQVDKAREYEAEIERLKAELQASKKAIQPPETQQNFNQQTQQMPQQIENQFTGGLRLNKEVLEKMDNAAKAAAQNMLGWSKEDVEALDYADDSDEKAAMWKQALSIAKNNIQAEIRQAFIQRQQQEKAFLDQHQKVMQDFNEYYMAQTKEPDYKEIQDHALEMLANVNPVEQETVRNAYIRVQRNTASAQDIYCVKSFFEKAKQDYRSKTGLSNQQNSTLDLQNKKIKQAEKFPRSSQVGGSASTEGTALTPSNLEYMLETMDWDDMPDKAKELLLGASIRG